MYHDDLGGPTVRQRRVADSIAAELSAVIQQRAKDPRLADAVVTGATVSRDLRLATVYVTSLVPDSREQVLKALVGSRAFLRRELAARVSLRFVPELRFELDETYDRAERIEKLLQQVSGEESGPQDT